MLGRDFNVVLDLMERVNVGYNLEAMISFINFILQAQVIDILLHGLTITWSNNREHEA